MKDRKGTLRQINLVPNFITAFGLACGLFVIFKSIMTPESGNLYDLLNASVLVLILAAFADFLDGAIARALNAETEFGFMFDSLADAITFGVAPSVLFLKSVRVFAGEGKFVFFSVVCAMVFSMCGVLRLVRFNVKTTLSKKNKVSQEEKMALKKSFIGLPIPAGAMVIVSLIYFLVSPQAAKWFYIDVKLRTVIIGVSMLVTGYLMICRWQFPSLKTLHIRVPSFHWMFVTVLSAIILLYGLLYYLPVVFLGVSVIYLLVGIALTVVKFARANNLSKRQ
ncbi:MAG: phosphatidylcholine/phosphatidylserine synthase [Rhabdochlamydiaceae bacterium]|nr:phosphatidylcholine/phosphatidylserine synthase [Candidatus Amphrikana amoebophyrae]